MTEQNFIKILTLENQFEANRLELVLKQNKIPFVISENSDLEYGNNKEKRGWGKLESYKEFEKDILNLYRAGFDSNLVSDEVVNDESVSDEIINSDEDIVRQENTFYETPKDVPSKKKDKKTFVIIILLISTLFFAYKFATLNYIVKRSSTDKNFSFSHERFSTSMKWKRNDNYHYVSEDQNRNGTFDKFTYYDINGKLAFISYDNNSDGIKEKITSFDLNGNTIGESYDQNRDAVLDEIPLYFNANLKLILIDKNFDRKWDSVIVNNKSYSVEQFTNLLK